MQKSKDKNPKNTILIYRNGFPPMFLNTDRHPYRVLKSQGWKTKEQLEKEGKELSFVEIKWKTFHSTQMLNVAVILKPGKKTHLTSVISIT